MALLHTDLQAIREHTGLTVSEIHRRTKTPQHVILDIEKGTIFDLTDRQKTYIRSFIRTYAKAIGIKDEDIIRALDAHEAGTYAGGLRKKYLPGLVQNEVESDETGTQNTTVTDVASDDEDTGLVRPGPTSTIGSDEFSRPDPSRQYNRVTPPPPKLDSVDWAKYSEGFSSFNNNIFKYIAGLIVVALLAAGIYYAYEFYLQYDFGSSETNTPISSNALATVPETQIDSVPTDSLETDTIDLQITAPEIPPSIIEFTIPETIFVVVHASGDKLEPVRVTSDVNNIRSPYWIELNEAMRFDFNNQIEIQGQLDRMTLFVNGHVLEDYESLYINDRTMVLTREFLTTKPEIFTTDPQPLPSGMSLPSVIRDRPIF